MERDGDLSEYQIQGKLGVGSFATVYRAENVATRLPVAIKAIPKNGGETIGDQTMSIEAEIRIATSVDHPFIAQTYNVKADDKNVYIIMEFVEEGSLLDYINKQKGLDEAESYRVFSQLVAAVKYLHKSAHIAHRDLKAENILLDRHNNIRLIDFGLSKFYRDSSPDLKTFCGSPSYAAPELIKGSNYSDAVDIWSLGVILYAMACGRLPFDDKNIMLQMQKAVSTEPYYPASLSQSLADLLKQLLCKDPTKRITIDRILEHPWMTQPGFSGPFGSAIMPEQRFSILNGKSADPEVVRKMELLGIDCKDIIRRVNAGELSSVTALYKLLLRNKMTDEVYDLQVMMKGRRKMHAGFTKPTSMSNPILPGLRSSQARETSRALGSLKKHPNSQSVPEREMAPDCPDNGFMEKIQIKSEFSPNEAGINGLVIRRRTRACTFLAQLPMRIYAENGSMPTDH